MNFSLIFTCILVGFFIGESSGRAIDKTSDSDSHQPTKILRNARSAPERSHTQIVREERSIHPQVSNTDAQKTQIVRAERSTDNADSGFVTADQRKTVIVRDRRAVDTSDKISESPIIEETRPERSPAGFSPFGRAEGEASAPRRKARSPAGFSPFGRAEGEASAPRRRARSPAYVPFGRTGH